MPVLTKPLTEVKITCGKTSCKVSRAFVLAQPSRKIRFANQTGADVHVHVSEENLCNPEQFTIAAGRAKTIVVGKVQRGFYPYAVFCECCGKFCSGSSMPIIIIP